MVILSADDFGISPGVNHAVIAAHNEGSLTHASLMVNMPFAREACSRKHGEAPGLKVGLHLNLSTGTPISPPAGVSALVDGGGRFRHGFVGLLLLPLVTTGRDEMRRQVEEEIESQIRECLRLGIRPEHIDSHRHVHAIPWIFRITMDLARRYGIGRVRILNESLLETLKLPHRMRMLRRGGLVKYLVLKTLYYINGRKSDTYFFGMLHGSVITPDMVKKIRKPDGFARMEILLHPGDTAMDREPPAGLPYGEKRHLVSRYRDAEYRSALIR